MFYHWGLRRSTLVVSLLASFALAQPPWRDPVPVGGGWASPEYKWLFEFPLPLPPVKQEKWPDKPIYSPATGERIRYYEMEVSQFQKQIYPNLPPTTFVGYDGVLPAPAFIAERGSQSVVRLTNRGPKTSSIHLHGAFSRAPFDGWADDIVQPGQFKDYFWPNLQNGRTIWYHDHVLRHTAENAYFGQVGAYIIHDPAEDALGLPSGKYDIILAISSKQYNSDGSLFSPANMVDSLYGDVIDVNGQPWPYFVVEPRRYRLRIINAAISRPFNVFFEGPKPDEGGETARLSFRVVGSDSGLLTHALTADEIFLSMGERYEVVVDFAAWRGRNVTLRNNQPIDPLDPSRDYAHADKVMRFVVRDDGNNDESGASADDSRVPESLAPLPWPYQGGQGRGSSRAVDQVFRFQRFGGSWRINGVTFADAKNRILAKPQIGTVQVWELINEAPGASHPVHLHLVDFRVLSRSGGGGGNRGGVVRPYEAAGLKDVVWVGPGERVTVETYFAPWPGVYMFHCHNLVHEDHMMMAAFNVSTLEGLGYNASDYGDPMDSRWLPAAARDDAYGFDAVRRRVHYLCGFEPYDHVDQITAWLQSYWATRTEEGPAPAATAGGGQGGDGSPFQRPGSGRRAEPRNEDLKVTAGPAPPHGERTDRS